jgi:hypothetical protein
VAKIAEGAIYKFHTGDIVDADTAPLGGALNPIFETIRVALNDADTRIDNMYTKAEVDAALVGIQAGQFVDNSVTNAKLATDVKVGSLASLTTTTKASITAAINEVAAAANAAVKLSGGNMTGDLNIVKVTPSLILKAMGVDAATSLANINFQNASGVSYWKVGTVALSSLGPSDLNFYNTSGSIVAKMTQTGQMQIAEPSATNHAATKSYVDGKSDAIEFILLDGLTFRNTFGYLEYGDGGVWKPVSASGIAVASNTVQESLATERIPAAGQRMLVYKFIPKHPGEYVFKCNAKSDASSNQSSLHIWTYALERGNSSSGTPAGSATPIEAYYGEGTVPNSTDWRTPLGTVFSSALANSLTLMIFNNNSYQAKEGIIKVHDLSPIYIYITSGGSGAAVKDIQICFSEIINGILQS